MIDEKKILQSLNQKPKNDIFEKIMKGNDTETTMERNKQRAINELWDILDHEAVPFDTRIDAIKELRALGAFDEYLKGYWAKSICSDCMHYDTPNNSNVCKKCREMVFPKEHEETWDIVTFEKLGSRKIIFFEYFKKDYIFRILQKRRDQRKNKRLF